ncbi:hypothetical protein [Pseudomonas sp. Pseusp16]|uniref:hypothetical protein n=1 Tax=Pseudomonas sp. Pseusp16 TaxID=3243021 RepID=UPI0039B3C202
MRDLLIWFFGTESSFGRKAGLNRSAMQSSPALTAAQPLPEDPLPQESLQPLKNWCHPFKDSRNPLEQLTHLANANAGYYPLGRNGLWHGGVHFDSGTAGTLKQSSVHCLADGEVVAYRIDIQSPTTPCIVNKRSIEKPFSRNFVLVRHRLQPPKIEGSQDTPPSLTFYSLYMHLQDWAVYQESTLTRPAFWPERPTHRVKQTANDFHPDKPEQRGLSVLHRWHGQVIDLLPRGAEVTISGTGKFRKLENTLGPAELLNPDGSVKGYIAARVLRDQGRKETRIQSSQPRVNVRTEPVIVSDNVFFKLPVESEVTVSGNGEFRKLECINQYVHFDSLENAIEPVAFDQVVVLDTPVPIKAGDLIGHLGQYRDNDADQPEEKLHLETFSGDDVELFIEASRAWAKRLPDKDKTWLKLAVGTPVVSSEGNLTAGQLEAARASSPLSAADLLVPKTLLDKLPANHKRQMPATPTRKVCNWYYLEELLHDASNTPLKGWVREEIGVTPWVSPWAWEGYEFIYDYDVPQEFLASFLRTMKKLSESQLERFGPMADEGDTGPLKQRLYDIIDRDRDGRMTAKELRAAISLPAHAQTISQLIVCCDSEWYYKEGKWDRLDELLGHSGSTPNLDWFAEKRRIKQMSWWNEVATRVGLPGHGEVYHFHPVGLLSFGKGPECLPLRECIELALKVSGGYEGHKMLDYHALADDFDQQGTSFGLIQWNFGQGTLGPVLLKMLQKDSIAFSRCFPATTDYQSLKNALIQSDKAAQLAWARDILRTNRAGWKQAFNALGGERQFQEIQLREAASYHSNVQRCIRDMRAISPSIMNEVGVLTYVALYDLCVQQGGLEKGRTLLEIRSRVGSEAPLTQENLLKICVQERAKSASSRWAADCMSRRMGIIQGSPYSANLQGNTANRNNINFHLLGEVKEKHVCDL